MSGYLGYSPDLVESLRNAMTRAEAELASIRCTDVDARAAMQSIARARATLNDTWLPFTNSLFQCRALDGYTPRTIDPGDLINSWLDLVATGRGWRLATDSLPTPAGPTFEKMTIEAARTLGEALSGPAGEQTMTVDEISWLQGRLAEVAGRPELVAAFLPAFTTVGWANVCNQFGETRQHAITEALLFDGSISVDERAAWVGIDAVLASLGRILDENQHAHPASDRSLLLPDMTPYAAALLVQHLDFDADTLAEVARELIERERVDLYSAEETNVGPRAADLLMATMLATPSGAAAYVSTTLDDPGLVLDVAFDPALGNTMLTAGTDPASMTPAQAKEAIPVLVGWILNESTSSLYMAYNPLLAVAAADLIAPYLLPILRPDADSFGMNTKERRAIANLIVDSDAALDHLLAARERIATALGTAISDPTATFAARKDAVHDLAGVLGIIDTMVRAADIREAERVVAEYELAWSLIGAGANGASSYVENPTASAAVGSAGTAVRAMTEWFGLEPTSVAEVRATSLNHFDVVTTVAAASVVCATFDALVSAGRIPPGTVLPPLPDLDQAHVGVAYSHDFSQWLDELDPDVADELDAIKQTIASDHEAAGSANGELIGL